jgi:hypothetical protein
MASWMTKPPPHVLDTAATQQAVTPPDAHCRAETLNGKLYWFCDTWRTWADARARCEAASWSQSPPDPQ